MKTRDDNKIMEKLENISESFIRSSVKNSAKAIENVTRFDREVKVITVDGKEAYLV